MMLLWLCSQSAIAASALPHAFNAASQVTAADVRAAQTRVRPSALREVALELPATRWADVGGLAGVKQRLREAVEWPQRHPEALKRLGARVSQKRHYPPMGPHARSAPGSGGAASARLCSACMGGAQ